MKLNTSKLLKWSLLIASVLEASSVNAQSVTGLCSIATFLKAAVGVVAVVAILVLVINSFFTKSSVIGDVVTTVLIGCIFAVGATAMITATGLSPSCS
jgi:hypothetical protein